MRYYSPQSVDMDIITLDAGGYLLLYLTMMTDQIGYCDPVGVLSRFMTWIVLDHVLHCKAFYLEFGTYIELEV
jgi:hypothetical protein